MYTFITFLIVILCALIILLVFVQRPKGGGLASNFSASNQVMGVQRTTDLVEKLTWGFATTMFALAIVVNLFVPKAATSGESAIKNRMETTTVPVAPAPAPVAPAPTPAPTPGK
jgi:preprotein translocase subunit SecG